MGTGCTLPFPAPPLQQGMQVRCGSKEVPRTPRGGERGLCKSLLGPLSAAGRAIHCMGAGGRGLGPGIPLPTPPGGAGIPISSESQRGPYPFSSESGSLLLGKKKKEEERKGKFHFKLF